MIISYPDNYNRVSIFRIRNIKAKNLLFIE